jgi:O-antigen ligase
VVTVTVRRPRWYVWAAGALAAIVALGVRHSALIHSSSAALVVVGGVAVALVAATLWELPPAAMGCGAIVLSIFSGNWSQLGLPGFPFLPDRILLVGALIALALRSPGSADLPRVRVRALHLLLAVLVIYAFGSGLTDGAFASRNGVFDLLDRLGVIPFVMVLVAPVLFAGERERGWLLGTLVGLGAYLGLMAVFEVMGPHGLVFPHYIYAYDVGRGGSQAGGPFTSVVTEGFACYACAVAAVLAFFRWKSPGWRAFAAAVVLLALLGSFLSLERGVWIADVAGSVIAALAIPRARRLIIPSASLAAVAIGVALLFVPGLAGNTSSRVNDQLPVWDRMNQTNAALRMVAANPLFGVGWDNYQNKALPYFRQASTYPMTGYPASNTPALASTAGGSSTSSSGSTTTAGSGSTTTGGSLGGLQGTVHNSYLSYAVDLGLIGLAMWLIAILWGVGGAVLRRDGPGDLSAWRVGLLALLVSFLTMSFFDPLSQNFTELVLWTWAGVACAVTPPARLRVSTARPTMPVRRYSAREQAALDRHRELLRTVRPGA